MPGAWKHLCMPAAGLRAASCHVCWVAEVLLKRPAVILELKIASHRILMVCFYTHPDLIRALHTMRLSSMRFASTLVALQNIVMLQDVQEVHPSMVALSAHITCQES